MINGEWLIWEKTIQSL